MGEPKPKFKVGDVVWCLNYYLVPPVMDGLGTIYAMNFGGWGGVSNACWVYSIKFPNDPHKPSSYNYAEFELQEPSELARLIYG